MFIKTMKSEIRKLIVLDENEKFRQWWLVKTLTAISKGMRILDAGAGELRNKSLCAHLQYVSQDFCQYEGTGDCKGLQTGEWDTTRIDLICDITSIPEPDASFDVILCSEVLEHIPDPLLAIDELSRLLKPGGKLILTAPFASMVHFAPYHFCTGFSRYWYEHHLPLRGMKIEELTPNGDYFSYARQEMIRLGTASKNYGDWCWPLGYLVGAIGLTFFALRVRGKPATDLACFGWHCVAVKL